MKLSLQQAYNLAGIYRTDGDLERDLKFHAWIANRTFVIVDPDQSDEDCADVDIVITRERT